MDVVATTRTTGSAGSLDPQWVTDIKEKIHSFAERNEITMDDYIRILFFLDQEGFESSYMSSLKLIKDAERAFKTYLMRLVKDTETAEREPHFRQIMSQIYENLLRENGKAQSEGLSSDVGQVAQQCGFNGLSSAVAKMSPVMRRQLVVAIESVQCRALTTFTSRAVNVVNALGSKANVALAALFLSYEAIKNLHRWWKGEITGKRCAKNVVDAGFSVAAGVGGGLGGATIGALAGPLGAVAGGMIGGIIASSVATVIMDRLTRKIFDLPKDEAVEKAYNFFRVNHRCNNSEINTAFRRMCLLHHPDKGGKKEDFFEVQCHMATIKMSRGEM